MTLRIRVLIADDHDLVAEGLQLLIDAQSDMEVVGRAANGRDVVRSALALTPDVVLMDVSMPEMNGVEATRAIRERRPDTRVVAVSMHSNPEIVCRALEAGAGGYLVKRVAGRELLQAIRAVHAGRRYFSEHIVEEVIDRLLAGRTGADPLAALSARERQVLQLLVEGKSVTEIAGMLSVSPRTVETYRARLLAKLDIRDMPSLVRFAIRHGITALE